MKLDDELRSLKHLPENEQLKKRIYANVMKPVPKGSPIWKELIISFAIVSIAFFLLIVPHLQNMNTASTAEIKEIYTYFGGEEGKFKARASLLYTGMQQMKSETTVTFFNEINTLTPIEKRPLGSHIVDIIVVRGHEKERYQMSETALYAVDQERYYSIAAPMYEKVFYELYKPKVGMFPILVPVGVIVVNVWAHALYKKRRIPLVEKMPKLTKSMIVALICCVASIAYWFFIGPIWKPFLYFFILLYGVIVWRFIKTYVIHPTARKIELVKIIVLIGLMILFVYGQ